MERNARIAEAARRNLKWFERSGVMDPADGGWGVAERLSVAEGPALEKMLNEFPAWSRKPEGYVLEQRRADCNFEAALLFRIAAEYGIAEGGRPNRGEAARLPLFPQRAAEPLRSGVPGGKLELVAHQMARCGLLRRQRLVHLHPARAGRPQPGARCEIRFTELGAHTGRLACPGHAAHIRRGEPAGARHLARPRAALARQARTAALGVACGDGALARLPVQTDPGLSGAGAGAITTIWRKRSKHSRSASTLMPCSGRQRRSAPSAKRPTARLRNGPRT